MFEIRLESIKPYLISKDILKVTSNTPNNPNLNEEIIAILQSLHTKPKDEIWKAIDKRFSNKAKICIGTEHSPDAKEEISNHDIFKINYYDFQSMLYDIKKSNDCMDLFTDIQARYKSDEATLRELNAYIDILYQCTSYTIPELKHEIQMLGKELSMKERLCSMQEQEYKILIKTWDSKISFLGLQEIVDNQDIQKMHALKEDKMYPVNMIQSHWEDSVKKCLEDSLNYYHNFCNYLHTNDTTNCLKLLPKLFHETIFHDTCPSITTSNIIKELIILKSFFQQRYKELSTMDTSTTNLNTDGTNASNDILQSPTTIQSYLSNTQLLLSFFQQGSYSTIIKIQSDENFIPHLQKEIESHKNQKDVLYKEKKATQRQIDNLKHVIREYKELLDVGVGRMEMLKSYLELDVERRLNLDCPVVILM